MSWRYENYGTADLLTTNAETVETPHSRYGFAYQWGGRTYFGIPTTAKEIWAKCDVYFTNSYSDADRFEITHKMSSDGKECGFWSYDRQITGNCLLFVSENTSSRDC